MQIPRNYGSPVTLLGSAILKLTDTAKTLEMAELAFRSQRKNTRGQIMTVGEPLMNEEGINSVIGMINSLLNQVTVMSNINKTQVEAVLINFSDTLVKDLMVNRLKYGIRSVSARDKILTISSNVASMAVFRGYEEGDKRFLKGNVQEIHSHIESSQKSRGLLSRFNPFSK